MRATDRWKIADRRLTLTKIQDACKESAAIFDGLVWTHEQDRLLRILIRALD